MSCNKIATANDKPSLNDTSNPEPIARPSGKLCNASPMLTIIPVFNKLFVLLPNLVFELNLCL